MELNGRGALVTGAGKGLGAALARALAKRGAKVVLVARSEADLARAVSDIRAEGGEAHAIAADIAEKRDAHRIAGAAASLVGPIDLLVHNASTLGPVPLVPLLDTQCEDLERALAVNVVGPFRLGKIILGSMALRGEGTVLYVSSDAAVDAYPTWGAYGASKAASDHLARIWAREIEGTGMNGVRILTVDPGEMDTEMHAAAMPDADRASLTRPEVVAEAIVTKLTKAAKNGQIVNGARFAAQGES